MVTLRSIFLMFFVCLPAQANNTPLEQNVFKLGTSVKSLLLKYYHVQADEGNGELVMALQQRLKDGEQLHQQIQQQLPGRYMQQSQNVKQHWATFKQHLQTNLREIRESAFPELQVVTLMRQAANDMVSELDSLSALLQQHEEITLSAAEHWSRQQKRLLLQVVERYIERAASSMGAPLSVDGPSLNELAAQFEQGLKAYPQQQASAGAKAALNRIRGQWLFIEKSTSNESARLVPYLVMRYTDSILARLDTLAA